MFDPLLGQCYNITSGLLYENVAGDCRYRNITKEQFGLNNKRPFENIVEAVEECSMVTLQPWELREERSVSISHEKPFSLFKVVKKNKRGRPS